MTRFNGFTTAELEALIEAVGRLRWSDDEGCGEYGYDNEEFVRLNQEVWQEYESR